MQIKTMIAGDDLRGRLRESATTRNGASPGTRLDTLVQDCMKSRGIGYGAAMRLVLDASPELTRQFAAEPNG
jgi:hypothetical protein